MFRRKRRHSITVVLSYISRFIPAGGGAGLLRNFALQICGVDANWSMEAYKDQAIAALRAQIGDQLTCVFVDTGLMRKGEADEVVSPFRDHHNIPLVHHDASAMFLGRLDGVDDPEQKRKIIGKSFIED